RSTARRSTRHGSIPAASTGKGTSTSSSAFRGCEKNLAIFFIGSSSPTNEGWAHRLAFLLVRSWLRRRANLDQQRVRRLHGHVDDNAIADFHIVETRGLPGSLEGRFVGQIERFGRLRRR